MFITIGDALINCMMAENMTRFRSILSWGKYWLNHTVELWANAAGQGWVSLLLIYFFHYKLMI